MGEISEKIKEPLFKIEKITLTNTHLLLNVNGIEFSFEYKDISELLEKATNTERSVYRISTSGYGIHWPLLDEDISIKALIEKKVTSRGVR